MQYLVKKINSETTTQFYTFTTFYFLWILPDWAINNSDDRKFPFLLLRTRRTSPSSGLITRSAIYVHHSFFSPWDSWWIINPVIRGKPTVKEKVYLRSQLVFAVNASILALFFTNFLQQDCLQKATYRQRVFYMSFKAGIALQRLHVFQRW